MRLRALIVTALVAASAASAESSATEINVAYTGRLLGYFRNPDVSVLVQVTDGYKPESDSSCPGIASSSQAALLMNEKLLPKAKGTVLVGMGDNFAPELFARVFRVKGKAGTLPKDTMYWSRKFEVWKDATHPRDFHPGDWEDELSGRSEILNDNAGCAIKQLGYRALVVGKHDFYYGPERLRQLARFLTRVQGDEQDLRLNKENKTAPALVCSDCKRVELLAANLAITTSRPNAPPPLPDFYKKLAFEVTPPNGIAVDLPAVVLPWTRAFRISGGLRFSWLPSGIQRVLADELHSESKVQTVTLHSPERPASSSATLKMTTGEEILSEHTIQKVRLCPAAGDNPDKIDLNKCSDFDIPSASTLENKKISTTLELKLKPDFMLIPGKNYGLCVDSTASTKPYCARFHVYHPYLQFPMKTHQRDSMSAGSANPAKPETWIYSDTPRPYAVEGKLAIFGVVDPDMKESIGPSNYTWIEETNGKQGSESTIVFADPVSSLEQLLQICELDEACKNANKILLAQMPADQALLLNARLGNRFRLVIAQTDTKHATANESRTLSGASAPGFVVTPRQMYESSSPASVTVRLQVAKIVQAGQDWTLSHSSVAEQFRIEGRRTELVSRLNDYAKRQWGDVKDSDTVDSWSFTQRFQRVVLDAMRRRTGTDVALLQKRDLFQPAEELLRGPAGASPQDVLDRILWKGDFVFRLPVTGAALKAAAAKSKVYAAQDRDALNTELESGRELLMLGMVEDKVRKTWLIRGEVVEDGRLYSAAMTDYLAFGETGYSDFRKPAVPPMDPLSSLDQMRPLSAMVCKELSGDGSCGKGEYAASNYLDASSLKLPNRDPGFTARRQFLYWLSAALAEAGNGPMRRPDTPASEKATQNGAYWGLGLDRIDIGYAGQNNRFASEDDLKKRFAGVPISRVQSPNSTTLTFAYRARGVRSSGWGDWYALTESSYNRVFTRQLESKGGGFLKDQKSNLLAFEAGANPRIWPWFKQVPDLKGIVAFRYQTQLVEPILTLGFSDGAFQQPVRRASSLSGRFGLRYQTRRGWYEAGYQTGAALNLPTEFARNGSVLCGATGVGGDNLADCIKRFPKGSIEPKYRPSLFQHGWFLNWKTVVPLPVADGWQYVMENRGDYYHARQPDTPIDTRFLDTWSHSAVIPIRGNFSVVPRLEYFFFANKKLRFADLYIGRQLSIGLQYRFEWREGLPLRKALQYPSPVPK